MWWRWSVWNVRAMTATIASAPMDVAVPESHLDLLTQPIVGVFTTMPPDDQPQSSLVWVDHDGEWRPREHDARAAQGPPPPRGPRAALLIVDPGATGRFLQVRGDAPLVTPRGPRTTPMGTS